MSINEWLLEYDRLVKERDRLYKEEEELLAGDPWSDFSRLNEDQITNAYAMRDLADEAATIIRSIQRGDHL